MTCPSRVYAFPPFFNFNFNKGSIEETRLQKLVVDVCACMFCYVFAFGMIFLGLIKNFEMCIYI